MPTTADPAVAVVPTSADTAAVVVPVKAFSAAKRRLAPVLDAPGRARLARAMAATVIGAAAPHPVVVVCDDPEVRSWASGLGAHVLWTPGLGLDGAVEAGVGWAGERWPRLVVAHADLPMAAALGDVGGGAGGGTGTGTSGAGGATLVPDRHLDGTNVISIPAGCGFRFAYGPGSFARHRAEAERLGLEVTVLVDTPLGWDVDTPDDLDLPSGMSVDELLQLPEPTP